MTQQSTQAGGTQMSKNRKKSKKATNKKQRQGKKRPPQNLPFIIHASPMNDPSPFPSHTHGLAAIGLPEFLMDLLAFGPEGNAGRINASYFFFNKPENAPLLDNVLNGEIVKLTMKDLDPTGKDARPYVYCYRLVDPTFEAVKQAYLTDDEPLPTEMKVIQIWVEGDNYAITDAYYAGGIKF